MAKLPDPNTTIRAIDAAVEANVELPRGHIGASQIGGPCDRALFYSFRWSKAGSWPGRMLRLFDRGKREEAVFADLLRLVGVRVVLHDPATGHQLSYDDHGGHFSGSLDGIVQGLVEEPTKWHVLETKTAGDKPFKDLVEKGVEKSKPEHYVQMQCYMAWAKLDRAYYLVVNKNTDELYGERVKFHPETAKKASARALRVIEAPLPPPRLSDDPTWWQCKLCSFHGLCHGQQVARVNCRTCMHATPERQGSARWSCAHHQVDDIPLHGQREGCDDHRFIPPLVPVAECIDADADRNEIRYRLPTGEVFSNGALGPTSFSSAEIAKNGENMPAMLSPEAQALRQAFGGAR